MDLTHSRGFVFMNAKQTPGSWFLATRPQTLWASASPVIIGTALAYKDGGFHLPSALAALCGALLIQIGTNFANDYFDTHNGIDRPGSHEPARITQGTLLPASIVKLAVTLVFLAVLPVALFLTLRAGLPILFLGIISIFFGFFYSAGPRPFSHLGLGDILVLVFFGPVAVGAAYYCQALTINGTVFLAGLSCGFLSTAIMVVNNLRDIQTDRMAGKITLAVRCGERFTRYEYVFCLLAASAIVPLLLVLTKESGLLKLLPAGFIFACIPLIHDLHMSKTPQDLNMVLSATGQVLSVFTLLFSILWIL